MLLNMDIIQLNSGCILRIRFVCNPVPKGLDFFVSAIDFGCMKVQFVLDFPSVYVALKKEKIQGENS